MITCSVGYLVGYATSSGQTAAEWSVDRHAQYTTALLECIDSIGHTATMQAVLATANELVSSRKDRSQVPAVYDNMGAVGSAAYFHGVQALLPLGVSAASDGAVVRVGDVTTKLLAHFDAQVRGQPLERAQAPFVRCRCSVVHIDMG